MTASTHSDNDLLQRHAERAAARRNDAHGAGASVDVVVVPDLFDDTAAGASPEFHIEVDNVREVPMRVSYTWQLVTDDGRSLSSGKTKKLGKVAAGETWASESWRLPALPDGFYQLVVLVAASDAQKRHATATQVDWYLEVEGGSAQELTSSEWQARAPFASQATEVL